MTQELTPNTQITQENVGLLKAGDVCRVNAKPTSWHMSEVGDIVTVLKGPDSRGDYMITPNSQWYSPDRLTYIGPDLGDGWIGWGGGENPVPGMRVDTKFADGTVRGNDISDFWEPWWSEPDDPNDLIIAFRPATSPPAPMIARPGSPPMTPEMSAVMEECMAATYPGDDGSALSRPAEGEDRCASHKEHGIFNDPCCPHCEAPTPATVDHIGDVTEKIDWQRVGPKLVEALEDALGFIEDMAVDLRHARVADWYPEAANNAANAMSEDMRCAANRCADYEPAGVDLSEIAALAATQPQSNGE